MSRRPLIVLLPAFVLLGLCAPSALASELIPDVDITNVSLTTNTKGEALLTYTRTDKKEMHVIVYGAVNALTPDETVPQVRFKYDFAGGWGKYRNPAYWKTFKPAKQACKPWDGPTDLVYVVLKCKAADGSYWALQSWQRGLPLLGFEPWLRRQTAFESRISHWTGDLATLSVSPNWTYNGRWIGLFGRYDYGGSPVYGFKSTATGNPLGRYERNMYIDTYDSVYGDGWWRESGILTHKTTGTFCHSFVPQKPFPNYPHQEMRPPAPGSQYRVTAVGPGVTPDVQWVGAGLSTYDPHADIVYNSLFDQIMAGDRICAGER